MLISLEGEKRRWRRIGRVNRMPPTSIPRVAMRWTPAENRRGRPKETWRRSVDREMKALGWSWGQIAKLTEHDGVIPVQRQCHVMSLVVGIQGQKAYGLCKTPLCAELVVQFYP